MLYKNDSKKYSLKTLLNKRNKIAIIRRHGGLGDIVNQMCLFKTIKTLYPELHITYYIPKNYFELVDSNPYIDEILDVNEMDLNKYGYVCDISYDCGKYESSKMPFVDKHRSDIWAELSLGIKLIDHDFCIKPDINTVELMKKQMIDKFKYTANPKIAICPKSASVSKDIPDDILAKLINLMKSKGYNPCVLDSSLRSKNINSLTIYGLSIKEFISMISLFDYVISVDTGTFHLSAALEIPTVGVFPWTDSEILGKYHKKSILVQEMHRNKSSDFEKCPCWNWPTCFYKEKNKQFPLPCMNKNNENVIFNAFKNLIQKYESK